MTFHIDHTADHQHTEPHHTTPEIGACHTHVHHTNHHDKIYKDHTCTPVDHRANHITRRTPEQRWRGHIQITIAPMTTLVTQGRRWIL